MILIRKVCSLDFYTPSSLSPVPNYVYHNISSVLQGITTYEYVVAMRAQSEPPGPSVDDGDRQSLPSSPTSSAMTAISGRSSLGMSLQYKGAWCTPPRIFMDHQVLHPLYSVAIESSHFF